METAQQASQDSSEQLVSSVLAAEMPIWVRMVRECREKLKSEDESPESKQDPFDFL